MLHALKIVGEIVATTGIAAIVGLAVIGGFTVYRWVKAEAATVAKKL